MDRLTSVLLVAGLGCFIFAFLLSGLYPFLITDAKDEIATIDEVARQITPEFKELKDAWPVAFEAAFPDAEDCLTPKELLSVPAGDERRAASDAAWPRAHAAALRRGRDIYVAEACWHCHSQYVRPVANEDIRFGPVSVTEQDNNELQRPVLWGTRRVGPDLTYEGGKRSNDWHAAHLFDPQSTTPGSVMPRYPWYFRKGWQVYRRIDPRKAELAGLDPMTAYPYPGVYESEEEAQRAMERIRAALDPNLKAEGERMFVDVGFGPNADGLALITYLQWLGTWDWTKRESTP